MVNGLVSSLSSGLNISNNNWAKRKQYGKLRFGLAEMLCEKLPVPMWELRGHRK